MQSETTVTSKGHNIPRDIRRKAGIGAETIITWTLQRDGLIVVRTKSRALNAAQRHIRARAGTWNGKIPGAELLRRTRP